MPTAGWKRALWVIGPGLMVMLADTDAGSVITASQSGARWGFRLLALQALLVPVLYLVMERAVRIGLITGKGFTALVRETFGPRWAVAAAAVLLVSVAGALATEFAGIAGAGQLYGIAPTFTVPIAAGFLILLVLTGGHRRIEVVGVGLGLLELAFVLAAVVAHPAVHAVALGVERQPLTSPSYLALVAANVGAVVMPWMIFYQQSAVVAKGLTRHDLRVARFDTAVGAVVTQLVMAGVLVASAVAAAGGSSSLRTVGDISRALRPVLGSAMSRVTLTIGMTGAALVAAIVVTLAAAWAVAEAAGQPGSANATIRTAPAFYTTFVALVAGGVVLVLASPSLVGLAVAVEVLNAALLPFVLGLLFVLGRRTLPRTYRLRPRELLRVAFAAAVAATLAFLWFGSMLGV